MPNLGFALDPSLVLDLPLYQLDGASFASRDAYGHLCTATGALWTPQGSDFGGDDDIDLSNIVSTISSDTVGTFIIWYRPVDATPPNYGALIAFGDTDGDTLLQLLHFQTTGTLYAAVNVGGVNKWVVDTTFANPPNFSDNTWTCVALVQDGVSPVLYLDAVAPTLNFSTDTDKTVWFNGLTNFDNGFLGVRKYNSGAKQFGLVGRVGELVYYNRPFTPLEIQHNYLTTKWRYQ